MADWSVVGRPWQTTVHLEFAVAAMVVAAEAVAAAAAGTRVAEWTRRAGAIDR